jgi:hypothetical protein
MNNIPTPETDAIVRNAATADHPPTRLAATLTVKCEKLERERYEALELLASEKITRNHIIKRSVEVEKERDEAREALRAVLELANDIHDESLDDWKIEFHKALEEAK